MQNFEITYRKNCPLHYIVKKDGETYFEAVEFINAALSVRVALLTAFNNGEKVKVSYRGKISDKNKSNLNYLIEELWGYKDTRL